MDSFDSKPSRHVRLVRIDLDAQLPRTMGLPQAVAINMLDMIGVGPFITLPLLLGTMGGPQAMLGWVFGALLALCDGLVWAELGAAMPQAGGTYAFLRTIFPGRVGRFLAFLFCFQLMVSAPLSIASGAIGLSQYAGFLWTPLARTGWTWARLSVRLSVGPGTTVAIAGVALAVLLLYRRLANLRVVSYALWIAVMSTIAWVLVAALQHGHLTAVFSFPLGAFHLDAGFLTGLASAMLITTYDFWGYYNVTFLAGEVRDPGRTVPRAILLSIGLVTVLYLLLTAAVLAVVPWRPLLAETGLPARQALISSFMVIAYGDSAGPLFGRIAAVLVMVTAFSSLFSLLLGYSRIPFAAARDGNFFSAFGRLHPTRELPHVSLLYLGGAAALCCLLSLKEVIATLVVLRIAVQFLLQHVGVLYLRRTRPDLPRPFRVWLYPVPPLLALAGFGYIVLARQGFARELIGSALVILLGAAVFVLRERQLQRASAIG